MYVQLYNAHLHFITKHEYRQLYYNVTTGLHLAGKYLYFYIVLRRTMKHYCRYFYF